VVVLQRVILRWFVHRHVRYMWSSELQNFKRIMYVNVNNLFIVYNVKAADL